MTDQLSVPRSPLPAVNEQDKDRDLGFGAVVARESTERLLNRDGSFNVERHGLSPGKSLSLYHWLVTMTWTRFLSLMALGLLVSNALFAGVYLAAGPEALSAPSDVGVGNRWLLAFFFSVQTFATIGYGQIAPVGVLANSTVVVESFFSILFIALATGMIFARFSRPEARIMFSDCAVITPYGDGAALMLRLVNARRSQLLELHARLILARWVREGERSNRRFFQLAIERDTVSFLPLSWTLVHVIGPDSPLRGLTADGLARGDVELLVLLSGIDETAEVTVHARTSYTSREIRWGERFADIFDRRRDDELAIDVGRLSVTDPAPGLSPSMLA